jgi:hypothetical protein
MLNPELLQTKDGLKEFYAWLLWRAQEEDDHGREISGQAYREFAEIMQTESLEFFSCTN